ncbi:MAG TPA: DUF3572 domain-containing protein [Rhizomicrobium sp.]|jgi:hypothetical protein|nr:DUF3572 domain-containing protein [Rhizomicrobium sp.]
MTHPMTRETAEIIALKALAFLANSDGGLERFLNLSGSSAADLRIRAEEPAMQSAILDFLLHNEELVSRFCEDESLPARDVHMAHHVLSA